MIYATENKIGTQATFIMMKMVYDENSEFSRSILGIENQLQCGDSAYAQNLGLRASKNEDGPVPRVCARAESQRCRALV